MIPINKIEAAQKRLDGHIVRTPIIESDWINELLSARVVFKAECLQKTGSFKIRGASNKMLGLSPEQLKNGVVAYSSGNHAQGVAAAAQSLGIDATIIIPKDAPTMKIENTRALGAEVILYDRYNESREELAVKVAEQKSACIIPPYDDPEIICGQATIGLEILQQLDFVPDAVLCPCGGGGLVSGIASAIKAQQANVDIIAVEPKGFDDTAKSLAAGKRLANDNKSSSICDAIITPMPGEITFEIIKTLLHSVVTVDDDAVKRAVLIAFNRLKLVVEPGGAVGLGALLSGAYDLNGKSVVVVLSGGNMNADSLLKFEQYLAQSPSLSKLPR